MNSDFFFDRLNYSIGLVEFVACLCQASCVTRMDRLGFFVCLFVFLLLLSGNFSLREVFLGEDQPRRVVLPIASQLHKCLTVFQLELLVLPNRSLLRYLKWRSSLLEESWVAGRICREHGEV